MEYFHGGLSLQELVIPVLTLIAQGKVRAQRKIDVRWQLTPGSLAITTRFFSVIIEGESTTLFAVTNLSVRLEIRAGDALLSTPVSASYGFQPSKDVVMEPQNDIQQKYRPNTVTLMITEETNASSVAIYLLDADTGRSLAEPQSITLAIAI